jgi:hypothetical protein
VDQHRGVLEATAGLPDDPTGKPSHGADRSPNCLVHPCRNVGQQEQESSGGLPGDLAHGGVEAAERHDEVGDALAVGHRRQYPNVRERRDRVSSFDCVS